MARSLRIHAVALCLMLFALVAAAQEKDNAEQWMPLYNAVGRILAGKEILGDTVSISPGAYLVNGGVFANLKAVTTGEVSTTSLKEDTSRTHGSITLKVNDPEDAAYMMLRTMSADKEGGARYHTVVFMKDKKGHWVIEAWHASN